MIRILHLLHSFLLFLFIYFQGFYSYLYTINKRGFNYKFAFIFPFIISQFDHNNLNKAEPIIAFTFNMFILNLSCLFCFINIAGYLLSLYLIDKYKDQLDIKFPRLKRIINFYSKTKLFWLKFEIIVAFITLLVMLIANFTIFYLYYMISFLTPPPPLFKTENKIQLRVSHLRLFSASINLKSDIPLIF